MVQSNEEERQRFVQYRERLFNIGEVVALTASVVVEAASYETTYQLGPQDALIYASVISHLQRY